MNLSSDHRYGTGGEPLTPAELHRLRRSVDVAALERWLMSSGGELRRAIIAHFAKEVLEEDLIEIGRETGRPHDGASPSEAAGDLDSTTAIHEPPVGGPPEARAFRFVSSWQSVVMVMPPDDPVLRALWDAIEPLALILVDIARKIVPCQRSIEGYGRIGMWRLIDEICE